MHSCPACRLHVGLPGALLPCSTPAASPRPGVLHTCCGTWTMSLSGHMRTSWPHYCPSRYRAPHQQLAAAIPVTSSNQHHWYMFLQHSGSNEPSLWVVKHHAVLHVAAAGAGCPQLAQLTLAVPAAPPAGTCQDSRCPAADSNHVCQPFNRQARRQGHSCCHLLLVESLVLVGP